VQGYDAILDYLYSTYYANHLDYSLVTSSHWKKYGRSQNVKKVDKEWSLYGEGFGSYPITSMKNRVQYSIPYFLNLYLLKKHSCRRTLQKELFGILSKSRQILSFDHVKQVLAINKILDYLPSFQNMTVCIIGDGFGFLGNFLKSVGGHSLKILSVNLGRTLVFDVFYAKQVFGNSRAKLITEPSEVLNKGFDFGFIEAERYDIIKDISVDLFINIASMQEMDKDVIENYFSFIKESLAEEKYLYCCNRLKKELPDGVVTRIDSYPWGDSTFLFNELCPWYQNYPSWRPPFWKPFDGPLKHILAKIDS
jgi:hypothetical protein